MQQYKKTGTSNTKIINKKTKLQYWAKWYNKLSNILQKSNYDNTKNNSKKWLTGEYNSVQKKENKQGTSLLLRRS